MCDFCSSIFYQATDYVVGPLSVLSVSLSVTLVYYGQTVEWIKTTLGMEVGLGPGHNVLDWDRASLPERDRAPNFKPISVVPNGLIHPAVWHNRYGLKIVT